MLLWWYSLNTWLWEDGSFDLDTGVGTPRAQEHSFFKSWKGAIACEVHAWVSVLLSTLFSKKASTITSAENDEEAGKKDIVYLNLDGASVSSEDVVELQRIMIDTPLVNEGVLNLVDEKTRQILLHIYSAQEEMKTAAAQLQEQAENFPEMTKDLVEQKEEFANEVDFWAGQMITWGKIHQASNTAITETGTSNAASGSIQPALSQDEEYSSMDSAESDVDDGSEAEETADLEIGNSTNTPKQGSHTKLLKCFEFAAHVPPMSWEACAEFLEDEDCLDEEFTGDEDGSGNGFIGDKSPKQ